MVLPRSMMAAEAAAMATPNPPAELPHDMVVEIAGHVAATSLRPMDDISSLRASSRAMRAACTERAVGRRVALEREAAMKWADRERYRALVERLARVDNPEACFVVGLTLAFAHRQRAHQAAAWLDRAAAAGHKAAAYVLGLLLHSTHVARDAAAAYIRQVEGEVDENAAVARKRMTNGECERCRPKAVEAVREVTWNVLLSSPASVVLPNQEEGHRCTAAGCGAPQGWSNCLAFCSEGCRIRHEYVQFFSLVPLPVPVP